MCAVFLRSRKLFHFLSKIPAVPVNRNALIRYKTIDNCLRNRYRDWTLDDLIEACSDALYEYEGIDKGVSRRTVQMDIQMMRSEKLGYSAPIIVRDKKYYAYEDPDYSITNIPLTDQDLGKLSEVVDILKQFKGFNHFQDLGGMVERLEDKIHVSKTKERPLISFEKNENLKGLEFIDRLFQLLSKKETTRMTYQSFKARNPYTYTLHPAMLKEYRNRWFVLGKTDENKRFQLFALDRIMKLEKCETPLLPFNEVELETYFDNVIGVSVSQGLDAEEIVIWVDHQHAPYLFTKPLHHSQKLIEKNNNGYIISIKVQLNFELEREILGYGDRVKILSPVKFRNAIKQKLRDAMDLYETELSSKMLVNLPRIIRHKGCSVLNKVYSTREVNRMNKCIKDFRKKSGTDHNFAIRRLLQEIPQLSDYIFNARLEKVLEAIGSNLFLVKAILFDKAPDDNWYVTWHQDKTIAVDKKMDLDGYSGWTKKEDAFGVIPPFDVLNQIFTLRIHLDDTDERNGALKIYPSSHKKIFSDDEKGLLIDNSLPQSIDVLAGGLHIMKPLLLHASAKSTVQRRRRVMHLEFTSQELPSGLNWSERMEVNSRKDF